MIISRRFSKPQLAELRKIWEADKRVPTLSSRVALAQSYGVASKAVHNWFSRHKNLALKAGCFVEGTYQLIVPGWTPLVKVEDQAPEVAQVWTYARGNVTCLLNIGIHSRHPPLIYQS
jgi:hypothetical protein